MTTLTRVRIWALNHPGIEAFWLLSRSLVSS